MLDRKIQPTIYDAISFDFNLQNCDTLQCRNGIMLHSVRAGSQDVIEVSLVFKAGIWQETQTGLAQAVASLLKSGTSQKTSLQINEAIEYYGASLKLSANNDFSFLTLYCLSKHVKAILPIIKEIITDATFPESELNIYKQNALQRLAVNLRQSDFVANRNIDALLFGKQHPYGRYTEPENIEALHANALKTYHQQNYTAQNCTLFVAGNFEEDTLQTIIDLFGTENWNGGTANLKRNAFEITSSKELQFNIVNDENGVQGSIRMASMAPMRKDPIFPEIFVMNTIFGGYFGSRLMANIREDKGYTYGIHSSLISYQNAAVMMIGTEAGKEVCEATLIEIKKEMKLMQETLVPEQELLLVKNYLLGSVLGDLDGPFSIMQRWKNLILNEQTIDSFNRNIEVYKTISAKRIQELAQQFLNATSFYELVVI